MSGSSLIPGWGVRISVGDYCVAHFLTGCMLFGILAAAIPQAVAQPAAPAAPPGIPVTVVAASKRDVPILLSNIGSVQAFQTVLIRVRVDGTLQEIYFQEGQDIKKGDRLALIDPGPYQAAYDQAVAKKAADSAVLVSARLDLARSTELAKQQYAAQQLVDQRVAVVNQLVAQLQADDALIAAAKVNLDYTNITAPFDGRVGIRMADPGNVIRAADPAGAGIVTIAQIHPIAVIFTLPQDSLPAIQTAMVQAQKAGGKLDVFANSPDGKVLLGQGGLMTTDNTIDPTTGTIKLKASFPNLDNRLWPGQFVTMKLQTEIQRGVITVPSIAIQRRADGLFVYVIKDNAATVQPVSIGQDDGRVAVVTKGLDEGAQVVVAGQSRLTTGTKVIAAQGKPTS